MSDMKSQTFRFLQTSLGVCGVVALMAIYQNCGPQLQQGDLTGASTTATPPSTTSSCADCFVTVPNTQATPTPAPSNQVIGYVDGIIAEGDNAYIDGWVCASQNANSIDVHVYRGGPAGSGQLIYNGKGNMASEAAVAQQCGVSQGSFRFRFPLSVDARLAYAGQKLYIYGISPTGGNNPDLTGSGNFSIPAPNSRPVYRYWRSDNPGHLFTVISNELTNTSIFHLEGESFRLFTQGGSGLRPIYRCYIPSLDRHFMSTQSDCEGTTMEHLMGYASTSQTAGASRALTRCYYQPNEDHLTVAGGTDAPECVQANYQIEALMGYVP